MRTLNSEEAAHFLKVSIPSLEELAMSGLIPAAKISRAWVFTEQHLSEYLAKQIEQQTNERRDKALQGKAGRAAGVKTAVSRNRMKPTLPAIPVAA